MDKLELEKLLVDIKELQRSVRRANPFLREIMGLRAYAILSLPLGVVLLAVCLAAHFLVKESGSFAALSPAWKSLLIGVLALLALVGSVAKWIAISRKAAQVKDGANLLTVIKATYGGTWFNVTIPFALAMAGVAAYAAYAGHPWLLVSIIAIFIGLLCTTVAALLSRREYVYTGWYMVIAGLASLFLIETAPFLWLAVVWAGTFLVFGVAGLAAAGPREAGEER
jgi:hypothetical protein